MTTPLTFPSLPSENNSRSSSPVPDNRPKKPTRRFNKPKAPKQQQQNPKPVDATANAKKPATEAAKKPEYNKRGSSNRRTRAKTEGARRQEKQQQQQQSQNAAEKHPPRQPKKTQARRKTESVLAESTVPAVTETTSGLQRAMIVQGENGRARVLFSGLSTIDQVAEQGAESPRRASVSAHGSVRGRYDGLGLVGSPSAMRAPSALPLVNGLINSHRQRSLTAAHPQPSPPPQPRRLSSAAQPQPAHAAAVDPHRLRSQTVSNHVSMTGLRISMAQARPGNVLAPHVPLVQRASPGLQSNTYATGGYFAKRRASVSNVGLAVDPSHSIRIPAIMFQKPTASESEQSAAAAAHKPAVAAEPRTPQSNPDTPDASDGEGLALKRLQDMISSMRNLAPKPMPKPAEIALPPTPAAHPTSRFDSILEEDEDDEAEEQNLIDDADPAPVARSQTVLAA